MCKFKSCRFCYFWLPEKILSYFRFATKTPLVKQGLATVFLPLWDHPYWQNSLVCFLKYSYQQVENWVFSLSPLTETSPDALYLLRNYTFTGLSVLAVSAFVLISSRSNKDFGLSFSDEIFKLRSRERTRFINKAADPIRPWTFQPRIEGIHRRFIEKGQIDCVRRIGLASLKAKGALTIRGQKSNRGQTLLSGVRWATNWLIAYWWLY